MRRAAALVALILVLCASLLAACGGGAQQSSHSKLVQTLIAPSGQRSYKVKLPDGTVVVQAHSPALAEPPKSLAKLTPAGSTAGTVEQYDSVTTSTIPRSAHYVAGYVDGLFKTYWLLRGHWPVVVGISVSSRDGADCFDMEPGNPGPSSAGPWARFQFGAGNDRPCEYSMLSWMPSIKANLAASGISTCTSAFQVHCVRLWDADWTYHLRLDAGYACTQWTDHANNANLDESTCASWFYKATPRPTPTPHPAPPPAVSFTMFPTLRLKTPYGTWTERSLAESIDGALQHKAKYSSYLAKTLDPAALWFAHRIDYLAFHVWPKPQPDYRVNRAGTRRALLVREASGHRIA